MSHAVKWSINPIQNPVDSHICMTVHNIWIKANTSRLTAAHENIKDTEAKLHEREQQTETISSGMNYSPIFLIQK
jgi:hypothetical protein